MIKDNALYDLNFTAGIRATPINNNFKKVQEWIEKERLRTGGWGIVEGFNLSSDPKTFTVSVSDGVMINDAGEELLVEKNDFNATALKIYDIEEIAEVNSLGIVELRQRPFSPTKQGYFYYDITKDVDQPDEEEIYVQDVATGKRILIQQIDQYKLYVKSSIYEGRQVRVEYKTSYDRVDSVLLLKDGTFKYIENIDSTAPSHIDLSDYDNTYMLGAILWHIDNGIETKFYLDHRTYRKVYVNEKNQLYINGELYKKPRVIYREEPSDPIEDDFWYENKTNTLWTWHCSDDTWGWIPVNRQDKYQLKYSKMFTPDYVPEKNTEGKKVRYLFNEDETDLRYIPGTNALEIVIDNAPLMNDQFKEIVQPGSKEYLSAGIGFELLEELDRPTFIQVTVNHVTDSKPARETFQRAAVFVEENGFFYNEGKNLNLVETPINYAIGQNQVEVWQNGIRLIPGRDWIELTETGAESTSDDKTKITGYIKIKASINEGDYINIKISRWVWSFDQLDKMVKEIENTAKDAQKRVGVLENDFDVLNSNLSGRIISLEEKINRVDAKIDYTPYMKKTDYIQESNLADELRSKLIKEEINQYLNTGKDELLLKDCLISDYIIVNYISENMNRILIKDLEYELIQDDNNIEIVLSPELIDNEAYIYVTGFKKGRL